MNNEHLLTKSYEVYFRKQMLPKTTRIAELNPDQTGFWNAQKYAKLSFSSFVVNFQFLNKSNFRFIFRTS